MYSGNSSSQWEQMVNGGGVVGTASEEVNSIITINMGKNKKKRPFPNAS